MTDTTVEQRLREQGTLPVCPYDKRSPDYWTAPNDKPCPMCGGEPEGPDKCTGADLSIMAEAADRIEADAFIIFRLTAANKALTADRDDARQQVSEIVEQVLRQRYRAEAAEAKLAKVEHKAEKYDSVVKALSVCDGGRYRNDTIESCILALKARDRLSAELAEARKREERLQEFAKWAIREGAFQAADLDGLSIQEKAHELGLIEATTYSPGKHGPSDCAEEGDEWFVFSPALFPAQPEAKEARDGR